ncbi:NAD(P)-dependent oxidoreductase [Albimonas sp. CAU 1670]|uniref:NAD-dependent epimerase/dehydratase family protein n=1 Tax=Albimonas sp. CAU 1670 TaxID=3032599 RepID=UPI0023D978E1|nr:NAD(P)-dependent oxidoreductase [Albimonas sp. CAU 1670]MDF2232375.1 NAD(P)-dependent oxidoreductase [Albimonas sp. CAU 1670]
MTYLVTGAGGFVGLNLVEHLLTEGAHVRALNDRPLPQAALARFCALPGKVEVIHADVRDRAAMAKAVEGAAGVVHAAAITLGPAAALTPARTAVEVNTLSTAILLDEARRAGVARFVYPSSSAVYGLAPFAGVPVTEDREPTPAGLYGFTKLASEALVAEAARDGLTTVRARITALFGPWEHDTGVRETLSPPFQTARRILAGLPVRMSPAGGRDWTSARDVARALAILLRAEALPHDVYNLSASATWRPCLLAEALGRRMPAEWSMTDAPTDEGDLAYHDDLTRTRAPISGARFAADFGFDFMSPEAATEDYAEWLEALGPAAFGALRGAQRAV